MTKIIKLRKNWFEIYSNNSNYLFNSKSLQIYKLSKLINKSQKGKIIEKKDKEITPIITMRSKVPDLQEIIFVLTNNCNLECPYCSRNKLDSGATNGSITDECIDKVILQIFDVFEDQVDNKHIRVLFYGGEPLLYFNKMKYIMDKIKKYNLRRKKQITFNYKVVTNGTLLNEDIINFSKENLVGYSVSLDGIGRIHDLTRRFKNGKPSFETVKRNLFIMKRHKLLTGIITTISKYNMNHLKELLEFSKINEIPIMIQMMRFDDGKWDQNFIGEYADSIYKIVMYAYMNKIQLHGDVVLPFYILRNRKKVRMCPILNGRSVAIMPDGSLSQCQSYNISKEKSIKSFLASENFIVLKNKEFILPSCNECPLQYVCFGSCIADKINTLEHNTCKIFKAVFEKIMNNIERSKFVKKEKESI